MKKDKYIELINASQATIRDELLSTSNKKYELLMILRTFELLKGYILEKEAYKLKVNKLLQDFFQLPISDNEEALELLCLNIREGGGYSDMFSILELLNNEDLKAINSKVAKNG